MLKYFLSLVLIINSCIGFSQNRKIDSLFTLLKKDKEDTNKVNHLTDLGWEFKYQNPDTAIILGNQSLSLAEKSEWKKGAANSLGQLGAYYYLKADYLKALDYYFRALKMAEELGDKNGIARHLGNI